MPKTNRYLRIEQARPIALQRHDPRLRARSVASGVDPVALAITSVNLVAASLEVELGTNQHLLMLEILNLEETFLPLSARKGLAEDGDTHFL